MTTNQSYLITSTENIVHATDAANFFNLTTDGAEDQNKNGNMIAKLFVLWFICVFGTLGNVIVIATIRREPKLQIPGNMFIVNLAVADLIITAFSVPVIIVNVITRIENNETVSVFCQGTAYLKTIALHVSWYSLAFIALNRYYTVCRLNEYAQHFKRKNIFITIFLIWIWVVAINLPIMIGWAIPSGINATNQSYYPLYPISGPPVLYDISSHDCVLGVNGHGGYTYGNGLFVMSLPLISIVLCYALVYFAIVQNTRTISSSLNKRQVKKRQKKERRISFMLVTVVVVFLLCWMPAIVYDYSANISSTNNQKYDIFRLIVNWLALSNSGMNVILYGVMSRAFRDGYKRMVYSMFLKVLGLCCNRCGCGRNIVSNCEKKIRNPKLSSSVMESRTPKLKSDTTKSQSMIHPSTSMELVEISTVTSSEARKNKKISLTQNQGTSSSLFVPPSHRQPEDVIDTCSSASKEEKSFPALVFHENPKSALSSSFCLNNNDNFTEEGIYIGPKFK